MRRREPTLASQDLEQRRIVRRERRKIRIEIRAVPVDRLRGSSELVAIELRADVAGGTSVERVVREE
jgi:hypothetical protein